jgi:hypothetical protein
VEEERKEGRKWGREEERKGGREKRRKEELLMIYKAI